VATRRRYGGAQPTNVASMFGTGQWHLPLAPKYLARHRNSWSDPRAQQSLTHRARRAGTIFDMRLKTIVPGACFLLLVGAAGCSASVTPPPPSGSSCAPDDTVPCAGGSGYSCTGGDTPDEADSTLLCSDGVDGPDGTQYCCASFGTATTTCQQDPTVDSCEPPSIGFSCTGTDSPDEADSSLTCSTGVPGNAGSTLYCCQ